MKRTALVSLVVSAFLFLSVAAHAASASKQRLQGDGATLSFYAPDSTGCRTTGGYVSIYETVSYSTGAPVKQTWLYVDYYSYDDCDLSHYVAAYGNVQLTPGEFVIQDSGRAARVQKSLVLTDYYSPASIPLTLDLTWTGTGEPTRTSTHQWVHSATGRFTSRYQGVSREAQVIGSFTINSTNLLAQATTTMGLTSQYNIGSMSRFN